ncbi:MAG: putative serine protein kinase, PrkA [Phycisphaerales bacterium]|nr:putative serine protein kinase, PrkA [Phycisphaerales bacterium]
MTVRTNSLANIIQKKLDVSTYREQHWEGTLWDYLDLVQQDPAVARNAFQRVYDMIQSFGVETVTQFKQEYKRYKFFSDPIGEGADAIYGLESKLVTLVDFFKSASQGYGTEKRILLLHGPVGSSKSTIARLIKKGLEWYSRTDAGRLYTYSWRLPHKHGDEGM